MPDAHDPTKKHRPTMLTTDLALRFDPAYEKVSRNFYEHPEQFADAFAKAWFKLLHRDMGPVARYLGPWVPEPQLWQDPVPAVDHELVGDADVAALKAKVLDSGLSVAQLVRAAWASAASFRGTDMRGGANGARIRLEPQRGWAVNDPAELATVLSDPRGDPAGVQRRSGAKISLADLIVLAGGAAVEKAAKDAGHDVTVPFAPGRTDASQEDTDVETFAVLEPRADGFRNYLREGEKLPPETLLLDRANLLRLTAPEMTVLIGGLRALGANAGGSTAGVLTDRPGTLTTDFFVNLLDMGTEWKASQLGGERLRRSGPGHGRRPVDRHRGRPRLRRELAAAGDRRGLRGRRRVGEVRPRLRGGLGQGHDPRPVRPRLISISRRASRPGGRPGSGPRSRARPGTPARSRSVSSTRAGPLRTCRCPRRAS